MSATVRFDDLEVGTELPVQPKVVRREDVKAYADASGDQNPLHQDDDFARMVGFPGIIAHGMFTMAHLTNSVARWAGDATALVAVKVQFRDVVYMDETIEAGGTVSALDPQTRRATIDVWVRVKRDDDTRFPIKNSTAEVELA